MQVRHRHTCIPQMGLYWFNMLAIFLKPLILPALRAGKIKGFRKMAKVLLLAYSNFSLSCALFEILGILGQSGCIKGFGNGD